MRMSAAWSATALVLLATSAHAAPSAEEQAVIAPLQAFLAGIASGDKAAMAAQALPDAMITRVGGGKVSQKPVRALVDAMPAPGARKLEERIHDPVVRIDEDLAIVWAPYDFLVDGKVDHCGTDVVEVVRRDGHWLIAGLADTSRKACGAAKPAR
ncbi:MAG TPA: nuclear transport factor 2 family protein [Kofleriaceae bacterium]|nr:nuclear transport factor 2 family protein [Kofleriaceae bacterium]